MTEQEINKIYQKEYEEYTNKRKYNNIIGLCLIIGTVFFPPIGLFLVLFFIYFLLYLKEDTRYSTLDGAGRKNELKKIYNLVKEDNIAIIENYKANFQESKEKADNNNEKNQNLIKIEEEKQKLEKIRKIRIKEEELLRIKKEQKTLKLNEEKNRWNQWYSDYEEEVNNINLSRKRGQKVSKLKKTEIKEVYLKGVKAKSFAINMSNYS